MVISRADGIEHELSPDDSVVGRFSDQDGNTVYRNSGLDDQGLIFRFPNESVYVYWSTEMLASADDSNPTSPFTTDDYDATALFNCKAAADREFSRCPGGILRMAGGQASIVVLDSSGKEFTINFMTDYINATNREVDSRLEGDTWILEFGNGEVWQVPLAAVEGG